MRGGNASLTETSTGATERGGVTIDGPVGPAHPMGMRDADRAYGYILRVPLKMPLRCMKI
jgi:hypothetical protein